MEYVPQYFPAPPFCGSICTYEETLRTEHAAAGSALEKMEEARMCGLAGLWKVARTHFDCKVIWLFQVILVNG